MLDLLTAGTLAFLPPPLQAPLIVCIRETFGLEPFPPQKTLNSLTDQIESADSVSDRDCSHHRPPDAIRLHPLLTGLLAGDALRADALLNAARLALDRALAAAVPLDIQATPLGAPDYPPHLLRIADPPPLLWTRGERRYLSLPTVAIVGSRAASTYGLEVGHRLGAELAANGATVVSGLARGVDSAAHRGALTCGSTIAVFGSGVDVVYPAEHASLARAIAARGVLVSEFPPGTPPRRHHFPRRNRLISGLSLGVVVVEASARSGSLQTARLALEQGRDVMAVPGTILGERNRGSHGLLRDGAKLVEHASDILDELKLPWSGLPAAGSGPSSLPDGLSRMDVGEVYEFKALIDLTGLPAGELLRQLLTAETAGFVLRPAGARFLRVARPVVR